MSLYCKLGLAVSALVSGAAALRGWRRPQAQDHSQYELRQVQVIFRHGARTPLDTRSIIEEAEWNLKLLLPPVHTLIDYTVVDLNGKPQPPSLIDDANNIKQFKTGMRVGQLTSVGMEQLYALGKRMRVSYIEEKQFLSPAYSPLEIYVRSTNIERTIKSTRCMLAGLFQQKQDAKVIIFTTDTESEILYPNTYGCKRLHILNRQLWKKVRAQPDVQCDMRLLQQSLGVVPDDNATFIDIMDDMIARKAHGLPLPKVLMEWEETIKQQAVKTLCSSFSLPNREGLQLSVGPVIDMLLTNINDNIQDGNSSSKQKMYLYSGHDTTLVPILYVLGIFNWDWPSYASDLTFELFEHQSSKEKFMKVSYSGKDQLVRGCSSIFCPLDEFLKVFKCCTLNMEEYNTLCDDIDSLQKEKQSK
uniref:Lysophosphatidic acid phosphatase type 6 n=1 Tax=Callorhinchus milii TaxID=7868 RepID=V9KAY2_CALMI